MKKPLLVLNQADEAGRKCSPFAFYSCLFKKESKQNSARIMSDFYTHLRPHSCAFVALSFGLHLPICPRVI